MAACSTASGSRSASPSRVCRRWTRANGPLSPLVRRLSEADFETPVKLEEDGSFTFEGE